MYIQHVPELPLAANVCGQLLREVAQPSGDGWSLAHVLMNPRAWSLLHIHQRMVEVYIITRGTGDLVWGGRLRQDIPPNVVRVQAGDAVLIPQGNEHMLTNTGMGSLEHLVIAGPPFDPTDVQVLSEEQQYKGFPTRILPQPEPELCFDGAEILSYAFKGCPSIAFGWVTRDPDRRKEPHYHHETTEWIYVVEGAGTVEVNTIPHAIRAGDWIRIDPKERHALRNNNDQHMVLVCICSPQFRMEDVYYD